MQRTRGFTLIEVLVVIAIIGAIITTVAFVIPDRSDEDRAEFAVTLQQQILYASELALVQQQIIGLYVSDPTTQNRTGGSPSDPSRGSPYLFLVWSAENGYWSKSTDRGLQPRGLPAETTISIESDDFELLQQEDLILEDILVYEPVAKSEDDDEKLTGDENSNSEEGGAAPPFEGLPQLIIYGNGELPNFHLTLKSRDDFDATQWVIYANDGFNAELATAAAYAEIDSDYQP